MGREQNTFTLGVGHVERYHVETVAAFFDDSHFLFGLLFDFLCKSLEVDGLISFYSVMSTIHTCVCDVSVTNEFNSLVFEQEHLVAVALQHGLYIDGGYGGSFFTFLKHNHGGIVYIGTFGLKH